MQNKKKRIFIIDDDLDFVKTTKTVLMSADYKVSYCLDAKSALDKIHQFKPDLIILDVMMHIGSAGFYLAYDIRKDPIYSHVPILMITAIHQTTPLRFNPETDGEYLPVQKLLDKPVPPKVLLKEVAELLEKSEQ
ncbi:response regulator [Candidatus Pacearchaeota archaeon]|nr:response regulator [Candidatus Pacearchaeota archaeon]